MTEPGPNRATLAERKDADLGVLFAAWWLHLQHGEDTYAVDLLLEWCGGRKGLTRMQKLARDEGYTFQRGFWAEAGRAR